MTAEEVPMASARDPKLPLSCMLEQTHKISCKISIYKNIIILLEWQNVARISSLFFNYYYVVHGDLDLRHY